MWTLVPEIGLRYPHRRAIIFFLSLLFNGFILLVVNLYADVWAVVLPAVLEM